MKFIVIVTRTGAPEAIARLLPAEQRRAAELYRDGIVREVYTRTDGRGSIAVYEAADEAEVRRHLATLPMVQEGLLEIEIYGAAPYRGFTAGLD